MRQALEERGVDVDVLLADLLAAEDAEIDALLGASKDRRACSTTRLSVVALGPAGKFTYASFVGCGFYWVSWPKEIHFNCDG